MKRIYIYILLFLTVCCLKQNFVQAINGVEQSHYAFHYTKLNAEEQRIYRIIIEGCRKFQDKIQFTSSIDTDSLDHIFTSVLYDNPEYFWLESSQYEYDKNGNYTLYIKVTKNTKKTFNRINNYTNKIIAKAPEGDYEKAKFYFKWIAKHTSYDANAKNNQNIKSVFLTHSSVCNGYTKAFLYLCNKSNIDCLLINGDVIKDSVKEAHAWNIIKLNGQWYNVDTTWGDNDYNNEEGLDIDWGYLCFTDKELISNRVLSNNPEYSNYLASRVFDYPSCKDTSYNYFKLNNLYLKKYSRNKIYKKLSPYFINGQDIVSIQFSNRDELDMASNDMLGDYWSEFCNRIMADRELTKIKLYISGSLNVLTFVVE